MTVTVRSTVGSAVTTGVSVGLGPVGEMGDWKRDDAPAAPRLLLNSAARTMASTTKGQTKYPLCKRSHKG